MYWCSAPVCLWMRCPRDGSVSRWWITIQRAQPQALLGPCHLFQLQCVLWPTHAGRHPKSHLCAWEQDHAQDQLSVWGTWGKEPSGKNNFLGDALSCLSRWTKTGSAVPNALRCPIPVSALKPGSDLLLVTPLHIQGFLVSGFPSPWNYTWIWVFIPKPAHNLQNFCKDLVAKPYKGHEPGGLREPGSLRYLDPPCWMLGPEQEAFPALHST